MADDNEKLGTTAALYTAVYSAPNGESYAGLPAGSTVKNSTGNPVELTDALKWKAADATKDKLTLTTTEEVASVTNSKGTVVNFATLADAIAAAKDGDTVTLVKDVNTPATTYVINKSITIDLNSKTVTGSGYDGVFQIDGENAKAVIKNGKIVAEEQSGSAGKYTMAIWACATGCEVTLENLDVSQKITSTDDKQMDMIYTSKGTIIINSGTFESGTPAWTLNCRDAAYKDGTAKIIVNGGTFVGFDPMNNEAEGKGTSFVAEGVGVDYNENGSFTAKSGMIAQIVNANGKSVKAYATLSAALSAVQAGETVKLITNVSDGGFVAVNAGTLDLNGYNLTANGVMVMPTAAIIDSTQGVGKLTASVLYIANETNANYLPVKDSDGSYSLFEYEVSNYVFLAKDDERNKRKVDVFYFKQQFNSAANLSKNTADGVTATITLTWDGQENPVSFTLSADSVKSMMTAENNASYPFLSIVGYGAAHEKKISAVMTVSSAGVTFKTNAVVRPAPSSEVVD